MNDLFQSAVIELTTLSPLFIKGKDMDYGEGMLKGVDEQNKPCIYLIDNDSLCEYIVAKGKIDDYVRYFVRDEDAGYNDADGFAQFKEFEISDDDLRGLESLSSKKEISVQRPNRTYCFGGKEFKNYLKNKFNHKYTDEYDQYKDKSLQYFLKFHNILPRTAAEFKSLANGITRLPDSWGNKSFVRNALDQPFVPGSSIKGAIRNAILWKIMKSKKGWLNNFIRTNIEAAGNNFARRKVLKEKFSVEKEYQNMTLPQQSFIRPADAFQDERWSSANEETLRDFFRIVKVSDGYLCADVFPEQPAIVAVCVQNNQVYRKKFQAKLECLPSESKVRFRLSIDNKMAECFFGTQPPEYLTSVHVLLKTVHEFFSAVWKEECSFFENKQPSTLPGQTPADVSKTAEFYHAHIKKIEAYRHAFFAIHEISELVQKFPEMEEIKLPIKRNNEGKIVINIDKISHLERKQIPQEVLEAIDNQGSHLFRTGWGGGLMSKTQFLNLEEPQRRDVRNLTPPQRHDRAPKSRCVTMEDDNKAGYPLGWCHLKIVKNDAMLNVRRAGFKSFTHSTKSGVPNQFADLKKMSEIKSKAKTAGSASKCKYKKGAAIKNAPWKEEGDQYLVKIKGQNKWARLIGKNLPLLLLYKPFINGTVHKIENGIVTQVKGN